MQTADRGVRVRLLLDDVFTSGFDAGMAGLDSHPNIEICIFNLFYRGVADRASIGITNFSRVNRRMHCKSFAVDSQATVVGGRNIADEYFSAHEDAKFGDHDVVGIGPVVADVSEMFDSYWNHEAMLPLPAFAKMRRETDMASSGGARKAASAGDDAVRSGPLHTQEGHRTSSA